MKKDEIVAKAAKEAGVTKAAAGKVFQTVIACIQNSLTNGEKVCFVGFGTFSVAERKARTGRNPQTGKAIKIKAKKVPKFSAGSQFKAVVDGKAAGKKAKKAEKPAKKTKK
jgi:DNA-binding protein HU-beta